MRSKAAEDCYFRGLSPAFAGRLVTYIYTRGAREKINLWPSTACLFKIASGAPLLFIVHTLSLKDDTCIFPCIGKFELFYG
jgi:hypothetical protein